MTEWLLFFQGVQQIWKTATREDLEIYYIFYFTYSMIVTLSKPVKSRPNTPPKANYHPDLANIALALIVALIIGI